MAHLVKGDSKEIWRTLRGWYRVAEGKVAKPCCHRLKAQTVEREKLYDCVPPPPVKKYPAMQTARARTTRRRATPRFERRRNNAGTGGQGAGA